MSHFRRGHLPLRLVLPRQQRVLLWPLAPRVRVNPLQQYSRISTISTQVHPRHLPQGRAAPAQQHVPQGLPGGAGLLGPLHPAPGYISTLSALSRFNYYICIYSLYLLLLTIYTEPCCAYTLQRATWELPSEDKSDLETQVMSCHVQILSCHVMSCHVSL